MQIFFIFFEHATRYSTLLHYLCIGFRDQLTVFVRNGNISPCADRQQQIAQKKLIHLHISNIFCNFAGNLALSKYENQYTYKGRKSHAYARHSQRKRRSSKETCFVISLFVGFCGRQLAVIVTSLFVGFCGRQPAVSCPNQAQYAPP